MKKKIKFSVIIAILAFVVLQLVSPKKLMVEQKINIKAPIAEVFPYLNIPKRFNEFNVWMLKDSDIEITYYQPYSGKGSFYDWDSSDFTVGKGSATIETSIENQQVIYNLTFGESKDNNSIILDLVNKGELNTELTWRFKGEESPFYKRMFNLFLEGTANENILTSLRNLKKKLEETDYVEKEAKGLKVGEILIRNLPAQKMLAIKKSTKANRASIGLEAKKAIKELNDYLRKDLGLKEDQVGESSLYMELFDPKNNKAIFYVGIPLKTRVRVPNKHMELYVLPSSQVVMTVHKGEYDSIQRTYDQLELYARSKGLKVLRTSREVFTKKEDEVLVNLTLLAASEEE